MRATLTLFILGLTMPLFFLSCKVDKEMTVDNVAPTTFLSIDTIELEGPNRLLTRVKLHWSGTDKDGYVVGYRVAWDQDFQKCKDKLAAAAILTRTDSTFLLSFQNADGSDTADIHFMVQALDNKGLFDPIPKHIRIPVKNSPPIITIKEDGLPSNDTIYSVYSFPYTFSDPDGMDDLDVVQIKINDGAWTTLPKNINFISLVAADPNSPTGETSALIYSGENLANQNQEPAPLPNIAVPGLKINGMNRIYMKVKDLAGASGIDSTKDEFFFKAKTSDLLIIDAFKGEGAFIGDSMYYHMIGNVTTYDRIDFIGNGGKNRPKFWGPTLYLLCKQYKKVFWYSDIYSTIVGEVPLLLTYAVPAFSQYLRFNGKILMSVTFPDAPTQISNTDPIFSLVPIDSITSFSRDVRLRRDSTIEPKVDGFPNLKTTGFLITGVDLFYTKAGVDTLYYVPKKNMTLLYPGPGLPVALRTKNPFNNKSNLVFFGMELTYLSGDRQALQTLFSKVLNEEFNW